MGVCSENSIHLPYRGARQLENRACATFDQLQTPNLGDVVKREFYVPVFGLNTISHYFSDPMHPGRRVLFNV